MKISELTPAIIKDFVGITDDDSEIVESILMPAAKDYILGETGLTAEQIDEHEDLALAYCILVHEWYDKREYTISTYKQASPTVKTILGRYAVNYIG